jgi:lysophospholipase
MASNTTRLGLLLAAASAALLPTTTAAAVDSAHDIAAREVTIREANAKLAPSRRATDRAPNGYTPEAVTCPDVRPSIRNGSSLSQQEIDWTYTRRNETITPIRELLSRIAIPGFDSNAYLANVENEPTALPNIGLSLSGGGYRAMLNGAGAIAAWDNRSTSSTTPGNLGGLLQSATYVSALSGGAWLIGSLYTNNFTSVQASVNSPAIWQFEDSILEGPEQYALLDYYRDIYDDVDNKDAAGYQRSITDYWGRALSYQLVDAEDGGPGFTFSSIADDADFSAGRTPLPFLIALGRDPGEEVLNVNSTVYEFTPWELGSSDPTLHGYVPLKYVGSQFRNGSLPSDQDCINGFDNVGYVMGTSSSLFNQFILYLEDPENPYVPDDIPGFVRDGLTSILNVFSDNNNDIADWTPNPFRGYNPEENDAAISDRLTLVDGGEDLQNIPFHPLLSIERAVDVVFAVDSSADTNFSWPDGQSMQATYERSLEPISQGTGFPAAPGRSTFINLGLNARPSFFGCDSSNVSDPHPLIVYLPNYPYLYQSNITTFTLSLNNSERDAIIQNGWATVTQLNGTRDEQWPVCVGCAMLHRSFERTNTTVPEACAQCFDRYCWNGTIDESDPGTYAPEIFGQPIDVASAAGRTVGSFAALAVAAVVAGLMAF